MQAHKRKRRWNSRSHKDPERDDFPAIYGCGQITYLSSIVNTYDDIAKYHLGNNKMLHMDVEEFHGRPSQEPAALFKLNARS